MGRLMCLSVAGALAPRRGWVAVAAVCAVLAGCGALPSSGVASTTVGSNLTAAPNTLLNCGLSTCVETLANTTLPAGSPPLASPVTGTIVRWRLKTGAVPGASGTIQLRVLRPAGGGQFTGAGTGAGEAVPTTATTTTFSTQLPIAAGDFIGLDISLDFESQVLAIAPQAGNTVAAWSQPSLADGSTAAPGFEPNQEVLVNADVAAQPTSSVAIPACTTTGTLAATVTPDPDPAVQPRAIHFRIDGGSELTATTSGNPGSAAIPMPNGSHTLEYWGEDSVGGLESPHHTATVVGCSATPGGTTPGGTTPGGTTAATTSGASTSGGSTSGGSTSGGPTGTAAPPLVSNAFTIARAKQLRDGSIQLELSSPGAGGYQANATFAGKSRFARPARKRKTVTGTYGTAATSTSAAGAVTLVIHPTRQALAALRRTHRLSVSVAITFSPNGGSPSTQTRTVNVKKPKAKKKRPRR
jgi:hypothetical protein